MKTFLYLSGVLLISLSLFVGIGVGIGFALNWLLPAIDLGIGALIGAAALAFTFQTVMRLATLPVDVEEDGEEAMDSHHEAFVIKEIGKKRKPK